MTRINEHFQKLKAGYLFPEIARRTARFREAHAGTDIIRLGIGDVTLPLTPSIVAAFREGVDEMGRAESFRGYGPEQGYAFLTEAIAAGDFGARGVTVDPDEIFISDGSKCDTGNIQELFSIETIVAVQDPVYPVYVDTNVMAGRTGVLDEAGYFAGLVYLPCTAENGFRPALPTTRAEVVYLCSPNNPTGAVLSRTDLEAWVSWARAHDAVILFDAAYEAYIQDPSIPHSIYEIPGAKECAIEFRSFSKNAGFTGTRCAYTVVPKALTGTDPAGNRVSFHALWNRRHCTKFNGVSYPVQKAAAAVYSEAGQRETRTLVAYYMENARLVREGLAAAGLAVYGGVNAPYIWLKTPAGVDSWQFFDRLLEQCHVVGTPGSGFGPAGEGYFRLSAFNDRARIEEAIQRIRTKLSL